VISNGVLSSKTKEKGNNGDGNENDIGNLSTWKYVEKNPIPAYLVSVVIGKFSETESNHGPSSLYYY
jgi:aminopeptidase N